MISKAIEMMLFFCTAGFMLFGYPMTSAMAASVVVYTQPPSSSGGFLQSSWWEPDGDNHDQYAWDGFILQTDQAITEIVWRGVYDPDKFGSGGPVLDFTVAIYASIGVSQPDVVSPALVEYRTGGNAGETPAGTLGNVMSYEYKFVLPTPFQAAAGTKYWVHILAAQHGIPDWGIAKATGGDGKYFRRIHFGADNTFQIAPGDGAFTLLAEPDPNLMAKTFKSVGRLDGWIRETSQASGLGGKTVGTGATIVIGDTAANTQCRGILSFNTRALPDNAVMISAMIRIRKQREIGSDPFMTHNGLLVDIGKPHFGGGLPLKADDFNAAAGMIEAGVFSATPEPGGWYTVSLSPAAFSSINLTGTTQFRLRFGLNNNNDNVADYLRLFSGDFIKIGNRPKLKIEYSLP